MPIRRPIIGGTITFGHTGTFDNLNLFLLKGSKVWDLFGLTVQFLTYAPSDDPFSHYGLIVLFLVAATPVFQHPAVILAALAGTALAEITAVVLLGRLLKFYLMGYLASHAPRLLAKVWGIQGELRDVGVDLTDKS